MKPVKNIWCCREQVVFFLVSKVEGSWYIVIAGKEFWIGKNRPGFLNKRDKAKR